MALVKLLYGFDLHEENLEGDDFRFLISALRIPSENHSSQDSKFTPETSEEMAGVVKLKRSRDAFSPKNWMEESSSKAPRHSIPPTPIQEPDLHNYSRQSIPVQPHRHYGEFGELIPDPSDSIQTGAAHLSVLFFCETQGCISCTVHPHEFNEF